MNNKLQKYSDKEIIGIMLKKNQDSDMAFMEIYNRYSSYVHAFCLKILGDIDTAEDIFQDTFIQFYQNVRNNNSTNVKSFLIMIARNLSYNLIRNRKHNVPIEDFEFSVSENEQYDKKELLGLINNAIQMLDENYKEIFVMREYSGLSYKEISEIMSISPSNAKTMYFRAKQKIQKILQPYIEEIQSII